MRHMITKDVRVCIPGTQDTVLVQRLDTMFFILRPPDGVRPVLDHGASILHRPAAPIRFQPLSWIADLWLWGNLRVLHQLHSAGLTPELCSVNNVNIINRSRPVCMV